VISFSSSIKPYINNSTNSNKEEVLLPEKFSMIVPLLGFLATGILFLVYKAFWAKYP
jgi:hypothetical protein